MTTVRFFAAAAERSGVDEEPTSAETVGALRADLVAQHPSLADLLPRCVVLVDGARADDDHPLRTATFTDVLPPFAGG